jgi:1,4-dihydroxy-6-naphthoate synthase
MKATTTISDLPSTSLKALTFAHSPDPDDAYMFYGFASGAVAIPEYAIKHHLQDIESLNARAFQGKFEITAVSAHAYAYCSDRYWVMSCGASVGRGYGPILIKKAKSKSTPAVLRVAVPGKWTTAVLVLDLWLAENPDLKIQKVLMPFDAIQSAVARDKVDAGLIIHEGQLTYALEGLEKIWDAGAWWQKKTGLPLPLGLDVVRSNLGLGLAQEIDVAFRKSILHAHAHPKEALEYALQYGRGLDRALGKRFIGMYVNEDTLCQGEEVQQGLEQLYAHAYAAGLIPRQPDLTFI